MGNTASSNPLNNTFNKLAGFKKPDTCSPNNDGIFEIYRIWTTLIPTLIGIVILELLIIMFNIVLVLLLFYIFMRRHFPS
jgi:hypothetical protein